MKSRQSPKPKHKKHSKLSHHHAVHPHRWIALSLMAVVGVLMAVSHARASGDDADEKEKFDLGEHLKLKTALKYDDVNRIKNEKGIEGVRELDVFLSRTIVIKHTKTQETGYKTGETIEERTLESRDKIIITRGTKLAIESITDNGDLKVNFDREVPGSILTFEMVSGGKYRLKDVPKKAGYHTLVNVALIPGVGPRVNEYSFGTKLQLNVKLRVLKDQIHEVVKTRRKAQGA